MTELKRTQTSKSGSIKSVYLIKDIYVSKAVNKELCSRVTIVMMVCVDVGTERPGILDVKAVPLLLSPPAKKFFARDSMLGCWSSERR